MHIIRVIGLLSGRDCEGQKWKQSQWKGHTEKEKKQERQESLHDILQKMNRSVWMELGIRSLEIKGTNWGLESWENLWRGVERTHCKDLPNAIEFGLDSANQKRTKGST